MSGIPSGRCSIRSLFVSSPCILVFLLHELLFYTHLYRMSFAIHYYLMLFPFAVWSPNKEGSCCKHWETRRCMTGCMPSTHSWQGRSGQALCIFTHSNSSNSSSSYLMIKYFCKYFALLQKNIVKKERECFLLSHF